MAMLGTVLNGVGALLLTHAYVDDYLAALVKRRNHINTC